MFRTFGADTEKDVSLYVLHLDSVMLSSMIKHSCALSLGKQNAMSYRVSSQRNYADHTEWEY